MSVPPVFQNAAFLQGMNAAYVPPGFEGKFRQPFVYNVNFLNIDARAVVTATAGVQNDSYFVVVQQTADIWDAATGNTTRTDPDAAPMLVRLVDTSSGKFITDLPTPISAWFGTGEMPFTWLVRAQVYRPGGQIQVELTNNMGTAQNVRLSFVGFKVYQNLSDNAI